MLPLDEMLLRTGQGALVDAISRQFNLSRDQTIAAIEALTPAFSAGLRRATASAEGQAAFLGALGTGNHAAWFDDLARLFSPRGIEEGNGILGHVFGSKEVSRAVAEQAAAATRIQSDVLKRMLPALGALLMGGIARETLSPGPAPQDGPRPDNPFAALLEQMARMNAQSPAERNAPDTPAGEPPLGDLFGGDLIGAFLRNMSGGPRPEDQEKKEKPQADPFAALFATSSRMQKDYTRQIEAIFDRFGKTGR